MRVLSWFFAACALALALASARAAAPKVVRGEIEGAAYTWLQPAQWNRQLLLVAHGSRPERAPLDADFSPTDAAYLKLVTEGWLVAKTSYRRNGLILVDAVKDLDNVRAEVARRLGPPERVIVEGESLGGTLAVMIAERPVESPPLYQGVIALDPALDLREPDAGFTGLSLQPQIPVVFLCNRNEIVGPRHYRSLELPGDVRPYVPALLRVDRDGHANLNQAEHLFALRLLNGWLDAGTPAAPGSPPGTADAIDATRIPEPQPSRVFLDADRRGFTAHLTQVTDDFGNLVLDAQPADFAAIGLAPNAYFQVTLHDHAYRVLLGRDFSSVKRGEWVAFLHADGFFWLVRNFGNAAQTAGCQVGDLVLVRRYPESGAAPPPSPE